jgi:hypothetical protein
MTRGRKLQIIRHAGDHRVSGEMSFRAKAVTELKQRPVASAMTASVFVAGGFALVLGIKASRAFVEIGGGAMGGAIVRLIGVFMVIGAVATFSGIVRGRSFTEMVGLVLVSSGTFLYGTGVIVGLGKGGLLAGSLALGISTGFIGRVITWSMFAKSSYSDSDED